MIDSAFEEKIIRNVLQSKGVGRHAARSALRHLERGVELSSSMPELAVFSGITAEEEAAAAVFHALRKRKYAGAEKLNPRDHVHKSALYPFLNGIGNWFEKNKLFGKDPQLIFDRSLSPNEKELLQIRFKMKDPDGKLKWAQLDSPLEFDARVDDSLTNFELELTEVAAVNNAQNISKYIKSLANRRNRVLYAAPGGIPHVKTGVESFLIFRKAVVFTHLMTYLLIEPYCNRQQFVSQSLDAFLQLLNLLKKENLGK